MYCEETCVYRHLMQHFLGAHNSWKNFLISVRSQKKYPPIKSAVHNMVLFQKFMDAAL